MDMSRIRIEGLLAAFPKLVGSGKQHTYVETENVRYVYQPIEVSCSVWAAVCSQALTAMISTLSVPTAAATPGVHVRAPVMLMGTTQQRTAYTVRLLQVLHTLAGHLIGCLVSHIV
eukprot:GHRQ01032445.1.p1 GENE.GHRQ01032445.1~~GHRQ01032445.1.p1  ORF type:complete len:116 (-),score=2.49 GHRQ01032445.1:28-375(-)